MKAGAVLYGPSVGDLHGRLHQLLHERADWLLSYDDAGARMYTGHPVESLQHYRSMSSRKVGPRDNSEYLVSPQTERTEPEFGAVEPEP